MSELTRKAKRSPKIRKLATDLTRHLPQKDRWNEILAVFSFVQHGTRYVRDIRGVETLIAPEQMLEDNSGDCDDKSMLLAAMLEALGFSTRFCAVGFEPGKFSHVFVDVRMGNGNGKSHQWLTLDPTEPAYMGWRPPGIECVMVRDN